MATDKLLIVGYQAVAADFLTRAANEYKARRSVIKTSTGRPCLVAVPDAQLRS